MVSDSEKLLSYYCENDQSFNVYIIIKAVDAFGTAAENLLMKHGKNIVGEQFLLGRLANSVIDLYSSAVVLSRASKSLQEGVASAEHEAKLATVWVNEVNTMTK